MAIRNITYSNKVALNENPSVADINKVKADDMNEIKAVVNNNATETSTNTDDIANLQNGNVYSTDEIKTNKVWIDGKPIYRKVFQVNSFPNAGNSWVATGLSNIFVTDLRGFETNGNEQIFLSATYDTSHIDCLVYDYVISGHNQSIRIHTNSNRSSYSGYVWIEYTKTTD